MPKISVKSIWVEKSKLEEIGGKGPLWVKKKDNGYVVIEPPILGRLRGDEWFSVCLSVHMLHIKDMLSKHLHCTYFQ